MSDRQKSAKAKKQNHLEGLIDAREGRVSRLDQFELDEEDNVYDLVEEDQYAKIVEGRRSESSFVVDDNGMGYYDDGEEHVGVADDALDVKRKLIAAAEEGDSKSAKRARRLAEDSSAATGQRSMHSFVRTGQSTAQRVSSSKLESKENLLDINALMAVGRGASSGTPAIRRPPSAPKVMNRAVPRPLPRPASRVSSASRQEYSSPAMQASQEDYKIEEDDNNNGYDDSNNHFEGDDEHNTDSKAHLDSNNNMDPATTNGTTDGVSAVEGENGDTKQSASASASEPVAKLSLSKATRMLKVPVRLEKAEPYATVSATGGMMKPELPRVSGDSTGLALESIASLGSGPMSAEGGGSSSGKAIDQALWIAKRKVTVTNGEGEELQVEGEFMSMYWLDACENNGIIYLFGKVDVTEAQAGKEVKEKDRRYVSCCVAVHGSERNLFVLPRASGSCRADGSQVRADFGAVHRELTEMMVPEIIPRSQGQTFKCKAVKRKYAFEHGEIPRTETEYLKVVYSARHGYPNAKQCLGGKHIERIFGAGSSCLELFLLKRKLMGPCWITVSKPRTINESVSWCCLEVGVENPKFVVKVASNLAPATPPLISMCVSMKTAVNPSSQLHEIIALSALVHTKVDAEADTLLDPTLMRRFSIVRPLGNSCGNTYPPSFPHDLDSAIRKTGGAGSVLTCPNERAMLSMFFVRIQQEDPDLLASHNLFGFEFDVLLSRAIANKIPLWSKLGRLRRTRPPKGINDRDITAGRILCDTYKAAKEFLRETSYSLTSLASSQLNFERVEVDPVDVPRYFSSSDDILKIAHHTSCDAMLVQKLMLKLQVVPLTKQLTNLSGNLWSRTIRGARAERIEYLLLHEFHAMKYVLPEKKAFEGGKGRGMAGAEDDEDGKVGGQSRSKSKAAYAGGLVLEPKKGLYDTYILLLDFNSLYPSIIQEYNLCFTTVEWTKYMEPTAPPSSSSSSSSSALVMTGKGKGKGKGKGRGKVAPAGQTAADGNIDEEEGEAEKSDNEDDNVDAVVTGAKELPPLPDSGLPQGILPRVIKNLVDRRRDVKNMLKKEKNPLIKQQLDIRQKALKLTANSMYGCLGFTFSRFYARPIAAMVTARGREALQRTVDQATNQLGYDVIYGDTDSVMINSNSTDLAQVKEIGNIVKKEVNKLYKSLELDVDGIFKSMLLLKKKKYAAVVIKEDNGKITYEKELKGLDLVRRDWCPLSKDTGKFVVDQILSGNPREDIVMAIHEHLEVLGAEVRSGATPIARFVITKGLNKNPKDYPDCKGQAHLQVALAMLKMNKPVNIGDHIPYVICIQGPEGSMAPQRARHPDEVVRSNGELTLDYEWYLGNQILPPISRLCEPIEGTSAAEMSARLGLDVSKYKVHGAAEDLFGEDNWGFVPRSRTNDLERFKDCSFLTCVCAACMKQTVFAGLVGDGSGAEPTGFDCPSCRAPYYGRGNQQGIYTYLSNRADLLVRECVKKYYDCWLVCDDRACNRRTMQQASAGYKCTDDCHGRLVQEYTEGSLHTQLKYLESLFDLKRSLEKREEALAPEGATGPGTVKLTSNLSSNDQEVYRLLKLHMSNKVAGSAYNWVRPSLWSALFSAKDKDKS